MTTSAKPSDLAVPVTQAAARYKRDIERAHAEGVVEGRTIVRKEILDLLEQKYMELESVATPEGKALLQVTVMISEFLRSGKKPR